MNTTMNPRKIDRTNDASSIARELLKCRAVNDIKFVYFDDFDLKSDSLVAKIIKENDHRVVLILNEANSYEDTLFVLKTLLKEYCDSSSKLNDIIQSSAHKKPVSLKMKPNLTRQLIVANSL